jgi:hypothetical protein
MVEGFETTGADGPSVWTVPRYAGVLLKDNQCTLPACKKPDTP